MIGGKCRSFTLSNTLLFLSRAIKQTCTLFFGLVAVLLATDSLSQVIDEQIRNLPKQAEDLSSADDQDDGGLQFIVLPIPISSPSIGTGLSVVGAVLFRTDDESKPSFVGIGAGYLDSGTWGVAFSHSTYFAKDRYRADTMFGLVEVNYDFFGVGNEAGDSGRSIMLDQRIWGGNGQFYRRVFPNLYLGAQLWYYDITTTFPLTELMNLFPDLEPLELQMRNVGIGALLNYDSRNSRFKPQNGMLADLVVNYGRTDLGRNSHFSDDYQKVLAIANRYVGLSEKDTLAFRASLCRVWGRAPLFDICLFGTNNDLRGYSGGQYRDTAMFAVQVEYRRDLFWRLGATIFAGVGSVAPDFGSFRGDDLLPAGGAGLRFLVSESYGVNVSVDYARGKDSDAIYVRIGEAF